MFCLALELYMGGFSTNVSNPSSFITGSDHLFLKYGWFELSICAIPSLKHSSYPKLLVFCKYECRYLNLNIFICPFTLSKNGYDMNKKCILIKCENALLFLLLTFGFVSLKIILINWAVLPCIPVNKLWKNWIKLTFF